MTKLLFIILCICNLIYACSSDDEDVNSEPEPGRQGTFSLLLKEKVVSSYATPYAAKVWWKTLASADIHFVTGGQQTEQKGRRLSFSGDDIVSDTLELGAGSYTIAKLVLYNKYEEPVIEFKPTADYSFVLKEGDYVQKTYKIPNEGIYSITKDSLALAALMRVNFGSDVSKWPIDLTKAPGEWKFVEYNKTTKRIVKLFFNTNEKTVADYMTYANRGLWEDEPGSEDLPTSEGNWGDTGLKIKVLPEELTLMDALQDMDFCGNELEEIPVFLKSMKSVYGIRFADNKLTSLPKEMFEMLRLHSLDISGNPIKELPRLDKVSNLVLLYACHCQLTSLGSELAQYSNLTQLTLIGNKISSVGNLATLLPNLRTLDIRDNQLESITREMIPESLVGLFADNNLIASLPAWSASSLLDLGLSRNKLTSIPAEFLQLPKLEYLDLSGNSILQLPGTIGECKSLLILDLSECSSLATLPEEIEQCEKLRALYLVNNHGLIWSLPEKMKARYGKCQLHQKDENGEWVWRMGPTGLFVDIRGCSQVLGVPEPVQCN